MPRVRIIQNNFTSGEISPRLSARVDFAKYENAVEALENFIILPHGGITRRPGTRYVAEVKDSSASTRLVSFKFNTEQAYILEFGNHYVRFYAQNGTLEDPPGTPVEIRTEYDTVDLPDLHFAQSADTLYIAHKDHVSHKLERTSATTFTISRILLKDGPYQNETVKDTGKPNISPSAISGTITLTASAALFDFSSGSLVTDPFATVNGSKVVTVTHAAHGLKSGMWVEFTGAALTNGIPAVELNIWHIVYVTGTNTYEVVVATTPATSTGTGGGASVTWIHSEDIGVIIRIKHASVYGRVRVVDLTSTTVVTAIVEQVLDGFGSDAAAYRMGRFSHRHGFPRTVTFFEQRLYWAGSKGFPQTFWGSVEGDFENHAPGANDADAIDFTIGSNEANVIVWILGTQALMIGTAGGEFQARGGADAPVTPTNILVRAESSHGSSSIRPLRVSSVILFLQRAGKKLRQLVFSLDEEAFKAPDLSILAEHITSPGVVDLAYEEEPNSIVWMVRSDGVLLSMTYLSEHEVIGWARHSTGTPSAPGWFESVATIPHPNGDRDQTWVIVRRTINGATKRYVEFFDSVGGFYDDLGVDSGLIYSGAPTTTLSGLDHLEAVLVGILGDGAKKTDKTVSSGAVTLDGAVSEAEVGVGFEGLITTLRPEVQLDKTIQGLVLSSSTIAIRVHNSADIQVDGDDIDLREVIDLMDTAVPLATGDLKVEKLGIDEKAQLTIKALVHGPCTLLAIVRSLEIGDD